MWSKYGIDLWASFLLLILAGFVSVGYWMSPLGLGFSDGAKMKLDNFLVHEIYFVLFFTGPIILLITLIAMLFARRNKLLKNIIFYAIVGVMLSQISMLTYLTI